MQKKKQKKLLLSKSRNDDAYIIGSAFIIISVC